MQQLHSSLMARLPQVENAVYDIEADTFIGVDDDALVANAMSRFQVIEPKLRLDMRFRDPYPLEENTASGRHTVVRVIIPIEGDAGILPPHPQEGLLYGRVSIEENQLYLRHSTAKAGLEQIEVWIDNDVRIIESWQVIISSAVADYHSQVRLRTENAISARRKRFSQVGEMMARLGIPLRRTVREVYEVAVPVSRRLAPIQESRNTSMQRNNEYYLEQDEYEYILDVLGRMVAVMERTPQTFAKLVLEEELRDILLVILNGHYERGATGETFSDKGDTDIYLPFQGRSVFIAECKRWKGKVYLIEAINQLFGYTTWRDTKCALIFFCKTQRPSHVLKTIREEVPKHEYFISFEGERGDETQLKYTFRHPKDLDTKMVVTVMVFNVPDNSSKA